MKKYLPSDDHTECDAQSIVKEERKSRTLREADESAVPLHIQTHSICSFSQTFSRTVVRRTIAVKNAKRRADSLNGERNFLRGRTEEKAQSMHIVLARNPVDVFVSLPLGVVYT